MRTVAAIAALAFAAAAPLAAQEGRSAAPGLNPPWPRVVADLRGATASIPAEATFYPPLPTGALVPARGFGLDAGAHAYAGRLGRVRLGYGADLSVVRATQSDVITVNARLLAPQVSLNFGSALGWSYVSGGAGVASIRGAVRDSAGQSAARPSGALLALNVGGGARWFVSSHVAFTFDLRLHRIGQGTGEDGVTTGSAMLTSAAVGLSLK